MYIINTYNTRAILMLFEKLTHVLSKLHSKPSYYLSV